MNYEPKKIALVSGTGEAKEPLNAYDRALSQAGIGDLNLITVSSILPENCEITREPDIKPGSFTPTVIAKKTSNKKHVISAAITIAECKEGIGLICEHSSSTTKKKTINKSIEMVEKMAKDRNKKIKKIHVESEQLKPDQYGAVVAAAVFMQR
ncbi:pyruvoyl-dependent arginine decarboxylase [Methanonatronarchaeum sp. AMET6-2]|uniref:pyruvoyl-dependent arginine decarboxylase n=1 Tax=Methanonatronarchaeum sp. AMET6-2 TaxID=2933293 RepID=UPI0011FBAA99|nr:arginine decarboxylase, pyruvoyl-dependent [Methanonatronarchaeum sp. AMET6-2]RZN60304.1 MAG: arginine decarboxylase, pyruvoyl-dependent [Methanonatronarchaeia archaeon]UOY10551.1 arginine decarboxylase, pyruvoyl-dependent [Methanonatronarchaeum sp. AMET6-2]